MSSSSPERRAQAPVPDPGRCRRRHSRRLAAALLSLLVSCSAIADDVSTSAGGSCGTREPGDTRPRIGVALGGGGARGIAHISVLRRIEELGLPVDCIAGTSMGALVGGLYASGMSVDAMEELVSTSDWPRLFDDSLERSERSFRRKQDDRDSLATVGVGIRDGELRLAPGLLQGVRILNMFEVASLGVSGINDFDQLPIPYRAVATDLNTGESVVLGKGSLAMAMRASMSLPGIFNPVEVDGKILLDGGLVNQVPVDVVRAMGADIVIAVDVGTPLTKLDIGASMLQVVAQMTGIMTVGNTRRMLGTLTDTDILIVPELGDTVSTGDFGKAKEALAIGALAADAAQPRLAALAIGPAAFAALPSRTPAVPAPLPVIEFVRLDNRSPYADSLLRSYIDIPIGEPLDTARIEDNVLRAYSLGTLSSVTWEVVEEDGRSGVLVRATPRPHGPNYVQLGMALSADFSGRFQTNLNAALLFAPLTPTGTEGRVSVALGSEPALRGELYVPFGSAHNNVFYGSASLVNPEISVFDADGAQLATYNVDMASLEAKLGREFGNHGLVGFGYRFSTGEAEVEIGDPQLPDFNFEQGTLFLSGTLDRVDSLSFPRDGYFSEIGYSISRDWLGSDTDFDQFDFDAMAAQAFGRHSLQAGVRYHSTVSGIAPIQAIYRLGGRSKLVGYRLNELTGQHYAVLMTGYSYQLAEFLGRPALVGGTLEYGNAWERRDDIGEDPEVHASGYVGFDSWVGPMLFGVGWREDGDGLVFIEIGRPL